MEISVTLRGPFVFDAIVAVGELMNVLFIILLAAIVDG